MRSIHADLLACLDRENPRVHLVAEISAPDVGQVLRRASDQWFTDTGDVPPGPRVSETPASSTVASSAGALQLLGNSAALATRGGSLDDDTMYLSRGENPHKFLQGLRFRVDPALGPVTVRSFTAKIKRDVNFPAAPTFIDRTTRFQLQVYRATAVEYGTRTPFGTTAKMLRWTFTPRLSVPIVVARELPVWVGDATDVTFNLQNEGLVLDARAINAAGIEEVPAYYFVITAPDAPLFYFSWRVDTSSSVIESGIGEFERVTWTRPSGRDDEEWVETEEGDIPAFTLNVEEFEPTSSVVYALDMGGVPGAASTGRIVFERSTPAGTDATLELSTAGTGGPWTAVTHGDLVATKQQAYHLRVTLDSDPTQHRTPLVTALGLEFRTAFDVSPEMILNPLSAEVSVPWLESAFGEGSLGVVRAGRRDYDDQATTLGSFFPATRLEVDTWLASDHPSITRDKWLHVDRAQVSNRTPSETSETFTLLSYLTRLKRKIPRRVESINTVHEVAAGLGFGAIVEVDSGTPLLNTPYDGLNYYMRVRESTEANVESGFVAPIAGSTGTDQLDFDPALPGDLAAGDIIEVHSAEFRTDPLEWIDEDPADIWWENLTEHLEIPPERIGRAESGRVGRSGLPPTAAVINPANPAKRYVTRKLTEVVEGDELINELSFLMGGVTTIEAGQIVFVQVFELRDEDGNVTVAPAPVEERALFDARDYIGLQTPPGLEHRMTTVGANYGVNSAAAEPDQFPVKTTQWVDVDALAWLTQQDLDMAGASELPEEYSAWLYNSEDGGRFLASELARQLVSIGSTGLREWSFGLREARYDLSIGDSVAIITDQYTDHDPAQGFAISGWVSARAILTSISGDRRTFKALVPGLQAIRRLAGGNPGSIGGAGLVTVRISATSFVPPDPATATVIYDELGVHPLNATEQVLRYHWRPPPGARVIRVRARLYREDVGSLAQVIVALENGVVLDSVIVTPDLIHTGTGFLTVEEAATVSAFFPEGSAAWLTLSTALDSTAVDGEGAALQWCEIDYVPAA